MRTNCVVRDGLFVDPCEALSNVTDNISPGFSKKKAIARWSLVNMTTHKPARSYFGVVCSAYPNGFLFNFCPFCGVKIDEPFVWKGEELGRFGHHPDPANDFCIEVEELNSIVTDVELGLRSEVPNQRIRRAMEFNVGGDPIAVAAKATLREIEARAAISATQGEMK